MSNLSELVDLEALADAVDPPEPLENRAEPRSRNPEDLEVEILRGMAEQVVANPAAHDERAAALVPDRPRDRDGQLGKGGAHRSTRRPHR